MLMRFLQLISLLLGLACFAPVRSDAITFDGATTFQVMDGVGVNINYRGWEQTNLIPVLRAYMEQGGVSLFRVTFDLSDWEAVNDDSSSTNYNWPYYNTLYNSTEFNRLWELIGYLNTEGYSNRVCLAFMGWGPAWMMDADGRTLKPGMEDEWAEMMASVLIYARNTRGLALSLVTPNNEPDIFDEGIKVQGASQYTNSLHRLAVKLDAAGMTNLWFVGPDLSQSATAFIPEMLSNPTIMARVYRFGVHSYSASSAASDARGIIQASAYTNRSVWVTEYNVWCDTCDDGIIPTYPWSVNGRDGSVLDARGTAEYLLNHLQRHASSAFAWEGFDSIYAHHYAAWGFFGMMGVNDTNALVKTFTPRKNFYAVAQVSKWVRPGAKRIAVSSQGPFGYLTAFKHDALGQVVICGVNTSPNELTLSGVLTNVPAVSELTFTYTDENTNMATAGILPVGAGGVFTAIIPADSVFTLTGFTAKKLTNGVLRSSGAASLNSPEHFFINLTNPLARAQFELEVTNGDVSLVVDKDLPSDGMTFVRYKSSNPGTNREMVVLRPGSGSKTLSPGTWFASVINHSNSVPSYAVKVSQWVDSGAPLVVGNFALSQTNACLAWNSLAGAAYVVQGKLSASTNTWAPVSGTLYASGTNMSFCVPLPSQFNFFRVIEGVAAP
jgi:O-glycosyl hydrolase